MATMEDKENEAPFTSTDSLQQKSSSPPRRNGKKGRSKSIGPGGLDEQQESARQDFKDAKNRRKSTYVPATKAIISTDIEKAERQAARRRTLANRRVSFAPEATLHTWDVVEFMRDPTTSTDSTDSTRRASNITRSSNGGTPFKNAQALDSDPPSTPPEQADEPASSPTSPGSQRDLHQKKRRRESGVSPTDLSSPDDPYSTSAISGSSDTSGSEDEVEVEMSDSDDETDTAMSLDVGENTSHSLAESDASSTGSSARLEAALKSAARAAGTRGIEYDEYGDASMELAGEEVTNAFKPWVGQGESNQLVGSSSLDQENVNPFSPAFKAQMASGVVTRPATVIEEDTGDLSMDVTRAVGGIVKAAPREPASSPDDEVSMELTQAVGRIKATVQIQSPTTRSGQKRRRSTTDAGSPGVASTVQAKRRRSSVARSSMGDDTMDLTIAVGGIQGTASPSRVEHRKSVARRRSSGVASEQDEATMEFTQAVGGIKLAPRPDRTGSSFDENEELTMELTTVLGGIKAAEQVAIEIRPVTPRKSQSPVREARNTTPKDQERFRDVPDSGPKKLLTPLFQKQVMLSDEKPRSSGKARKLMSPGVPTSSPVRTRSSVAKGRPQQEEENVVEDSNTPKASPDSVPTPSNPKLTSPGRHKSPLRASAILSPGREPISTTPNSTLKKQLDAQLYTSEPSPTIQKQIRSSPVRETPTTPEQLEEPSQEGRRLANSIKLMSTPRKETLKGLTPKKQTPSKQHSPRKATTPRARATPKTKAIVQVSPVRQLSEDLHRIQEGQKPAEKVQLQKFLQLANIRFMDLTASKRRLTVAPTPSKARQIEDVENELEADLETAVVAGGCTLPELEMYEHACHELKRYMSDGKKVIKQLEVETAQDAPPLIKAYVAAEPNRRVALDSQMRDMKTHARLRSKEMWYAWRSQLLDDLMKALQSIGEGLIRDDEILQHAEQILKEALPGLVEKHDSLQVEAERLEQEASATTEEDKEELENAREQLQATNYEIREKQKLLEDLQARAQDHETTQNDLVENKEEFQAAIKEAERMKEACRGVSVNEITALKESIADLEQAHGWSMFSASASPPTVTMTYKSQLQLFFHPAAFLQGEDVTSRPNAPISLIHTGDQEHLSTTLRFFLQLLRASIQALPQCSTRVSDLLSLVSNSWDTASLVAEAERRLNLEAMTVERIVSDERLAISSTILLPKVRTKVRVVFEVIAAVSATDGMDLSTTIEPAVKVVYGEPYNETKMTEFVRKDIGNSFEGWSDVVRGLRERLVARGTKSAKR